LLVQTRPVRLKTLGVVYCPVERVDSGNTAGFVDGESIHVHCAIVLRQDIVNQLVIAELTAFVRNTERETSVSPP
jgi:hypothetical protein